MHYIVRQAIQFYINISVFIYTVLSLGVLSRPGFEGDSMSHDTGSVSTSFLTTFDHISQRLCIGVNYATTDRDRVSFPHRVAH